MEMPVVQDEVNPPLCRRELEILKIIKEHEEKGLTDPYLDAIAEKLNISHNSAHHWVTILMRKRVLPVSNGRKFPPMRYDLAPKQKQVLRFIESYLAENNYAPSHEEIAQGVGLKNRMTVKEHVDKLRIKGYVDFIDGKNRTLQVIDRSRGSDVA